MALMVLSRVSCTWHNADSCGPVCQSDWIVLATTQRSLPEDNIIKSPGGLGVSFQAVPAAGKLG